MSTGLPQGEPAADSPPPVESKQPTFAPYAGKFVVGKSYWVVLSHQENHLVNRRCMAVDATGDWVLLLHGREQWSWVVHRGRVFCEGTDEALMPPRSEGEKAERSFLAALWHYVGFISRTKGKV